MYSNSHDFPGKKSVTPHRINFLSHINTLIQRTKDMSILSHNRRNNKKCKMCILENFQFIFLICLRYDKVTKSYFHGVFYSFFAMYFIIPYIIYYFSILGLIEQTG